MIQARSSDEPGNERMSRLNIVLILIGGALLLWGLTRAVSSQMVYDSVHAVGYRVGTVLPQGYDGGSELRRDQHVRLEPVAAASIPVRMPASLRQKQIENPEPVLTGVQSNHGLISLIVMGCAALALLAAGRVRRWSELNAKGSVNFTQRLRGRMVSVCLVVVGVGLVIGPIFVLARIFWTGVDDAFIERSMLVRPGSHSVHIVGDTTLSMNSTELLMLYFAVVLTVLPVMFVIAVNMLGDLRSIRTRWMQSRLSAPARGLLAIPAVRVRINANSLMGIVLACYVVLTMILWCAPWSTTMARAVWSL